MVCHVAVTKRYPCQDMSWLAFQEQVSATALRFCCRVWVAWPGLSTSASWCIAFCHKMSKKGSAYAFCQFAMQPGWVISIGPIGCACPAPADQRSCFDSAFALRACVHLCVHVHIKVHWVAFGCVVSCLPGKSWECSAGVLLRMHAVRDAEFRLTETLFDVLRVTGELAFRQVAVCLPALSYSTVPGQPTEICQC
jgi:hypothetical protein